MTEKSWKNKARRHQKANGISYTRARREVDGARAEPDAGGLWSAFGINDASNLDVGDLWAPHALRPVPLGLTPDGRPVWLDLNEPAAGGHGPHGLLVGTTGSGKTVALQSLVLSLCVLHSPEVLQLVLVSRHNGSGLAEFSSYPHVTFASTTTGDDLDIRRTEQVLTDLITQRVMTLHHAGTPNIGAYHRDRASRPEAELPPMPHVVVVIDECSALLHDRGTARALSEVLRMGRSVGVHILGAVQNIEMADPARMVLEGHSTYIIVFKTTAQQARYLLGSDEAADFINAPGAGMLILDGDPVAFHAFSPVSNSVIKSVRRQLEKAC